MKLIRKSIFALASALMLTACSSDEPFVGDDPNGGSQEGEGVYMGLTIQMPGTGGSRSETVTPGQSTDGNEVGKDYENNVNDVIIVFAKPDNNGFITAGTVTSDKLTPITSANAYKTVAKINKTRLNTYYEETTNRVVNVFVFCNPTAAMQAKFPTLDYNNTNWLQDVTTVSEDVREISQKDHFLMANASLAPRQLPATIAAWDNYKTEATAFDLSGMNNGGTALEVDNSAASQPNPRGAVKVERAAARFDFKDGSTLGDYTYNVVLNSTEQTLIQVQLTKMSMVNVSKSFYDLRRVSANGLNANAAICGNETPTNYVVGPNADAFTTALGNNFGKSIADDGTVSYSFAFDTYYHNPFFQNNGYMDGSKWNTIVINNYFKDRESDEWKNKEYMIWRYASENVIPATPSNQQNGISTGVVFKGKMIGTPTLQTGNEDLYNALNNVNGAITGNPDTDPILYSYNGTLYFTWPQVRQAAIEASVLMENGMPKKDENGQLTVNRSNSLYLAVFGTGKIGSFIWGTTPYEDGTDAERDVNSANTKWIVWNSNKNVTTLKNMRAAVTGAGFTIYQSSNDDVDGPGYYCYYYYWNRHNDNGQAGIMGPMEFAVVRNNVYKLAVTNIKQLGHPRIPENDPDNPNPDTPDESSDIYITVTCEVLPWVVRVNNIEF